MDAVGAPNWLVRQAVSLFSKEFPKHRLVGVRRGVEPVGYFVPVAPVRSGDLFRRLSEDRGLVTGEGHAQPSFQKGFEPLQAFQDILRRCRPIPAHVHRNFVVRYVHADDESAR